MVIPQKKKHPATFWRPPPKFAAGKGIDRVALLGLHQRSPRLGSLTPGYQLTLLRSWRIFVINQNVRAPQDVVQKENSGTHRFTKAFSCFS
jgi:hypothetical protein